MLPGQSESDIVDEVAGDQPVANDASGGSDARVVAVEAWDPDGDNGTENDSQASFALADGNPNTSWATECYSNQFMGSKRGVGLILSLSSPASGRLSAELPTAPYQVDVYASADEAVPATLEAWGAPIGDTMFSDSPGTIDVGVGIDATHLMLWLKELGADDDCTTANPYRGKLAEVTFSP